jgi:hypothetical protein
MPLTISSASGFGLVSSSGWIDARRVEIVSDGFIVNGGRITALGPAAAVRLAATEVVHESRPDNSSVIATSALSVDGAFRQAGAVFNPNDGANPAVAAGLRQTPRLASDGFITKVDPGQTQLSNAPLRSPAATASVIPPPLRRSSDLAARRSAGSGNRSAAATAAGTGTTTGAGEGKGTGKGAGTVRKASFFGQRVRY